MGEARPGPDGASYGMAGRYAESSNHTESLRAPSCVTLGVLWTPSGAKYRLSGSGKGYTTGGLIIPRMRRGRCPPNGQAFACAGPTKWHIPPPGLS